MLKITRNKQCRNCLYHMGIIKCIVSPCMTCRVFGGNNPPISFTSELKTRETNTDKHNNKK